MADIGKIKSIYRDIVVSENWTIPQAIGLITPENVIPHPKNPTIADCFRQMGWVEDLGSGVRNMYKYCPIYVHGAFPVMEENDVFKLTVRYEKESQAEASGESSLSKTEKILLLIRENPKITAAEIAATTGISLRTIRRITTDLVNNGIIYRKGSDKDGEWVIIK
ncbi:MAG: winged helix-turn-helix transcriptional regulator [Prevotellaceae bacterium]|jgi:ATP-dependent DNA helicase RecG|nr:winged helix-turn-helix transcriptional regulator [Prevotellaceae bacterium]